MVQEIFDCLAYRHILAADYCRDCHRRDLYGVSYAENEKRIQKLTLLCRFRKKIHGGYSPEYRFYNGAVSRNLPIKYIRQETNGFEYFIYDDTLYLFPDFDGIDYIEDKSEWMVDYDGDSDFFDRRLDSMLSKLENRFDYPIRVLAERRMFYRMNLSGMDIPESIFITQSYDNAFENDASPLKMIVPQSTEELYGMMLETPDLCGRFELDKSAGSITWNLSENIVIEIGVDPPECYIGINKSHGGKVGGEITHLHPSVFEIYDEICKIGRRGNVTVLRASPVGSALLYAGREDVCPYPREKKLLLGKYYYLEACQYRFAHMC